MSRGLISTGRTLLTIAVCVAAPLATAQDRTPMGPGMGGPGMGGGPGGMQGPGPMRPPMQPILTATDKYVYILRGDTLYQFSADGLRLLGKAELPRPEPRDFEGKGPPRK